MNNIDFDRLKSEIGKRIYERRKQLGYTQEYVADKSNLSHQFFSSVETGKKNMKVESIVKLSTALNISCDYLLMGKSNTEDINNILKPAECLNERQIKCLEELIKYFVYACINDIEYIDELAHPSKKR